MKSDSTFSMKTRAKYSRVTEPESLREAYEVYSAANPGRPYIDAPSIQKVINFLSKQRPEMAKLKPEDFMDMTVLRRSTAPVISTHSTEDRREKIRTKEKTNEHISSD